MRGTRTQQATSIDSPFGGAPNPYARDTYYSTSNAPTQALSEAQAQALREALRHAPLADAIVNALVHAGIDVPSLARAGDDSLASAISRAVPALCAMCREATRALPPSSSSQVAMAPSEAALPPPPPSLPMSTMSPPRHGGTDITAANVVGIATTPSAAAARRQREQSSSVSFGGYGQDTEPDDVGVRRPRRSDAGNPNELSFGAPQVLSHARGGDTYGNTTARARGTAPATPHQRRQREQASSVSFGSAAGGEEGPSLREQAAQRKKEAGLREQAAINDHARAVFLENQRLAQQVKARTETLELSKGLGAAMGFDDDADDQHGNVDVVSTAAHVRRQQPQARGYAEQAQAQALHTAYLENQEIARRAKHRAEQQELAERGLADVMGLAEDSSRAHTASGSSGSAESLAQRKARKHAEAAAEHERLLAAERERTRVQRAEAAQRLRRGSGGPQSAVTGGDRLSGGFEQDLSGQGACLRDYMQARELPSSTGEVPADSAPAEGLEPRAKPEVAPVTETFAERKARKRAEAAAEHERLLAEERVRMHQAHEARRQSFSGESHPGAVGLVSPQAGGDSDDGSGGAFSSAGATKAAGEGDTADDKSLPPPPGTPICNDERDTTVTEGDAVSSHRTAESFAERKARRQAEEAAAREKLLAEERERLYRERVQMQQRRGAGMSGDPDDRAI